MAKKSSGYDLGETDTATILFFIINLNHEQESKPYHTLLCGALTACSSDSDDSGIQVKPDDPVENVLFFDDFSTFDNSVWTKETHEPGWTNQELQAYEPGQVKVGKDGSKSVLMLTAEWKTAA